MHGGQGSPQADPAAQGEEGGHLGGVQGHVPRPHPVRILSVQGEHKLALTSFSANLHWFLKCKTFPQDNWNWKKRQCMLMEMTFRDRQDYESLITIEVTMITVGLGTSLVPRTALTSATAARPTPPAPPAAPATTWAAATAAAAPPCRVSITQL